MILYNTLVDNIAALHGRYAPVAGPSPSPWIVPGNWLPCAVDNGTAAAPGELPVVVAVGANYATGTGKLPGMASARRLKSPPWIEEDLSRWRKRTVHFLTACSAANTKKHWNGLLPFDPDQEYHLHIAERLQPEPHFVMSNLCPWITTSDWAPIRDGSLEDMFTLLANPEMRSGGLWSYFRELKKCVGQDAIWVGHGNAEVYGIFRLLCWKLEIEQWFFDSNLSYPSLMIK